MRRGVLPIVALSVTSSQNRKTWDATVRVTGGHPLQLWGIGESQRAAEPGLDVERVVVRDDSERMAGYGQLQIRREKVGRNGASLVVAECLNVHSNRASTIPALLDALADHAAEHWGAALFSAELDAPSSPELIAAVRARGWQRAGEAPDSEGGPRRLRVNLGRCESDLSSRLSEATLDRCRAGLKVSDVTVREVTERSGDLRASGLKTEQIGRLLHELGPDSLLLVAAQERPGQDPVALGYLWFVHTVGQAMLYRVGFTRTARELGIDDALLLTGAVELQKRGVQRLDGGDVSDPEVPTVVRELADVERVILGPWRKPLGADTMALDSDRQAPRSADGSEASQEGGRRRRGLFRRARSEKAPEAASQQPEETPAEPERTVAPATDAAADRAAAQRRRDVRRQISSDLGLEATDQTPAVAASDAGAAAAPAPAADAAAPDASAPAAPAPRSASPKAGKKAARKQAKARKRDSGAEGRPEEAAATTGAPGTIGTSSATEEAVPAVAAQPAARAPEDVARAGKRAPEPSPQRARPQESAQPRTQASEPERTRAAAPGGDAAAPGGDAASPVAGAAASVGDARAVGGQTAETGGAAAAPERAEAAPSSAQPSGAMQGTASEAAPVRPVDVRTEQARREREIKADQRRAERVAQKAEDLESRQKPPREPLGKRLRREAGGAIRDALGR